MDHLANQRLLGLAPTRRLPTRWPGTKRRPLACPEDPAALPLPVETPRSITLARRSF